MVAESNHPVGIFRVEDYRWRSLFAAFPLLVLQQTYASASLDRLPEARQLERLLRLPLVSCAGVGVAFIAIAGGFAWAMQIQYVIAVMLLSGS